MDHFKDSQQLSEDVKNTCNRILDLGDKLVAYSNNASLIPNRGQMSRLMGIVLGMETVEMSEGSYSEQFLVVNDYLLDIVGNLSLVLEDLSVLEIVEEPKSIEDLVDKWNKRIESMTVLLGEMV